MYILYLVLYICKYTYYIRISYHSMMYLRTYQSKHGLSLLGGQVPTDPFQNALNCIGGDNQEYLGVG